MSTQPSETRPAGRSRIRWTPKRIAQIALLVYAVLLALLNRDSVAVNFVFFKTEAWLFVVIALAIALGFLVGWLFDDVRERRRRKAS
jgi:uncharacterized integral membrane protein